MSINIIKFFNDPRKHIAEGNDWCHDQIYFLKLKYKNKFISGYISIMGENLFDYENKFNEIWDKNIEALIYNLYINNIKINN